MSLLTQAVKAVKGLVGSAGAKKVVAAGAATAVTGSIASAFVEANNKSQEDLEEVVVTAEHITPEKSYSKSELGILKFPLDIENAPIPHVLIKIFETQTGSVERTDSTSQTFFKGAEDAAKKAENLAPVAGAAAGAKATLPAAALLALGKKYKLAAGVLAGGAAAGGAAVASGAVGASIEAAANEAGELLGLGENSSDRFKSIINRFALKRNIEQLQFAIAMLMPETLSVSYQNNYESLSMTEAAGGIGVITQALGSGNGKSGDTMNPYLVEAAARLAQGSISDEFRKIGLFATTGRTVNPQLELIYGSPALREFTMDFRLVPRNATEASTIRVLIERLKYFAAPEIPKNTGGRYFIPPAQFELEFYDANNNMNQFLFRTKKCVLEDISVDFTGTGGFQTFRDGSPIETRLSLRFKETVFIDKDAINQGY